MLPCPHCKNPVDLRRLEHQGVLASHRVCPHCKESFEVDPKTRRRQTAFIVLATVSLVLTVLMYFDFHRWAVFAVPTYVILGALIYLANKRVYLVKYDPGPSNSEEP